MSVTFYSPEENAPYEDQECFCTSYTADETPTPNCTNCKGTGYISVPGPGSSINLANANARDLLHALGEDSEELLGSWKGAKDLAHAYDRIFKLANSDAARDSASRPEKRDGNFVSCGQSSADLKRKALYLLNLVVQARLNGWNVHWS